MRTFSIRYLLLASIVLLASLVACGRGDNAELVVRDNILTTLNVGGGLTVSFDVADDWSVGVGERGFVATMTIHNGSDAPLRGWSLGFDLDATLLNLWNADHTVDTSVSPPRYTLTHLNWNRTIAPGHSESFGFEGRYQGTDLSPGNLTLNGQAIDDNDAPADDLDLSEAVSVDYTVRNEWPINRRGQPTSGELRGFQAEIVLTNTATEPIDPWTLAFDLPATVKNLWQGDYQALENSRHLVTSLAWNSRIDPGASVSFGFNGEYVRTDELPEAPEPTNYALNSQPLGQSDTTLATFTITPDPDLALTYRFDAVPRTSTPQTSTPLSYTWTLAEGVEVDGEWVTFTYLEPGTYPVTLTVSDGTTTETITQDVVATLPTTAEYAEVQRYVAIAQADPRLQPVLDSLQAEVDAGELGYRLLWRSARLTDLGDYDLTTLSVVSLGLNAVLHLTFDDTDRLDNALLYTFETIDPTLRYAYAINIVDGRLSRVTKEPVDGTLEATLYESGTWQSTDSLEALTTFAGQPRRYNPIFYEEEREALRQGNFEEFLPLDSEDQSSLQGLDLPSLDENEDEPVDQQETEDCSTESVASVLNSITESLDRLRQEEEDLDDLEFLREVLAPTAPDLLSNVITCLNDVVGSLPNPIGVVRGVASCANNWATLLANTSVAELLVERGLLEAAEDVRDELNILARHTEEYEEKIEACALPIAEASAGVLRSIRITASTSVYSSASSPISITIDATGFARTEEYQNLFSYLRDTPAFVIRTEDEGAPVRLPSRASFSSANEGEVSTITASGEIEGVRCYSEVEPGSTYSIRATLYPDNVRADALSIAPVTLSLTVECLEALDMEQGLLTAETPLFDSADSVSQTFVTTEVEIAPRLTNRISDHNFRLSSRLLNSRDMPLDTETIPEEIFIPSSGSVTLSDITAQCSPLFFGRASYPQITYGLLEAIGREDGEIDVYTGSFDIPVEVLCKAPNLELLNGDALRFSVDLTQSGPTSVSATVELKNLSAAEAGQEPRLLAPLKYRFDTQSLPSWLRITSGAPENTDGIPPGEARAVTFEAVCEGGFLEEQRESASVTLYTNDPEQPEVTLSATLRCSGNAAIPTLEIVSVDSGSHYSLEDVVLRKTSDNPIVAEVGEDISAEFEVYNLGNLALNITRVSITTSPQVEGLLRLSSILGNVPAARIVENPTSVGGALVAKNVESRSIQLSGTCVEAGTFSVRVAVESEIAAYASSEDTSNQGALENAPLEYTIPVTCGEPDIDVPDDGAGNPDPIEETIEFQPGSGSETKTRDLTISNCGSGVLEFRAFFTEAVEGIVSVAPSEGSVPPAQSVDPNCQNPSTIPLTITFICERELSSSTTLRITSNDPDEAITDIPVSLECVPLGPEIRVSPEALTESFDFPLSEAFTERTTTIEVSNVGTAPLIFSASASSAQGISAISVSDVELAPPGTDLPGSSTTTLSVTFTCSAKYTSDTTLTISWNDPDPDRPNPEAPINLECTLPPAPMPIWSETPGLASNVAEMRKWSQNACSTDAYAHAEAALRYRTNSGYLYVVGGGVRPRQTYNATVPFLYYHIAQTEPKTVGDKSAIIPLIIAYQTNAETLWSGTFVPQCETGSWIKLDDATIYSDGEE